MATKNIVPRANGEGGIGTSVKRWLSGFFKNINVDTEAIVPTPANNDNSTKAATTAFVENTFFNKLVAKLLATTAATITSLSTSSLFYRFLAQALSVAGVQYNLSNSSAWYICLGSLFGGLIIQGGAYDDIPLDGTWVNRTLPASFTGATYYKAVASAEYNARDSIIGVSSYSSSVISLSAKSSTQTGNGTLKYIAMGI